MVFRRRIKAVFIVGCVRSGTTFLQSFFSAHPDIFTFHESHFFYKIKKKIFLKENIRILKEAALEFFKDDPDYKNVFLKKYFTVSGVVREFIRCLDQLTVRSGKNIWVEKTPLNLNNIERITKYLPEAKFIHIIREGKAVVASHYEVSKNNPEIWGGARTISQCVERWNNDIRTSWNYRDTKNHYIVKYEYLIRDMEDQINNITNFAEIKFSDDMINNRVESAKKIVKPYENWKNGVLKEDFNPVIDKFEAIFNNSEKQFIEKNILNLSDYFE